MSDTPTTASDPVPSRGPWGPWATIGFGLLIAVAFMLVQLIVAFSYLVARFGRAPNADASTMAATVATDGLLLALATLATAVVCTGLVVVFARARHAGSARQYLKLTPVSRGTLLRWLGAIILLAVAWDLMTSSLGRPVIPPFLRATYTTAGIPVLYWIALVVAAPVFEELFFRGFLLTGLRHSRLGASGAVLLTAALWAILHLQYDHYQVAGIFLFGLMLGAARVRTASTLTPLLMHALLNFLSLLETAVYVSAHIKAV